jgi:hypothetical protein
MAKIYIAGPMTGIEQWNFPAFDRVADILRSAGHTPVSPADIDRARGFDPTCKEVPAWFVMKLVAREDIEAISNCAGIAMLPGWERSAGATAEAHYAHRIGLQFYDAETGLPTSDPPAKSGAGVNPKDLIGVKKPPIGLIPPAGLIQCAAAMKLGASKYGPYNWRASKVAAMVYVDAALRHLLSYIDGEDVDEESGASPLAHVMACCAIVLDAMSCNMLSDNRPIKGSASQLLKRFTDGQTKNHE